MKRKALSLVLTILVVTSVLPVAVFTFSAPVEAASPSGDTVVVYGNNDGEAVRVDPGTGADIWRVKIPGVDSGSNPSVTVLGGQIYAANDKGELYRLDPDTGEPTLVYSSDKSNNLQPVSAENGSLYLFDEETVYRLDRSDWSVDKKYDLDTITGQNNSYTTVDVQNGNIYLPTETGRAYLLNASDKTVKWNVSHSTGFVTGALDPQSDYALYHDGQNGTTHKLDISNGSSLSSVDTTEEGSNNANFDFESVNKTGETVYVYEETSTGDDVDIDKIDVSTMTQTQFNTTLDDGHGNTALDPGESWFIAAGGINSQDSNYQIARYTTSGSQDWVVNESVGIPSISVGNLGSNTVTGVVRSCPVTASDCSSSSEGTVSGATVEILAVNHDKINASGAQTLKERAEEILANSSDVKPEKYYNPDFDPLKMAENAEGRYVVIHQKSDWGLVGWTDESQLTTPQFTLEPKRMYVVSIWDASKSDRHSALDNDVDEELPGRTANGTVVIEQLGSHGETISRLEVPTSQIYKTGTPGLQKKHKYGTVSLPQGFYRVSIKGESSTEPYVIAVGDPQDTASSFATQMRTKAGNLTERAKDINSNLDQDKVRRVVVETGPNGSFSANLPAQYDTVGIVAYKGGDLLSTVKQPDRSLATLRDKVKSQDYEGSVYVSDSPVTAHPPDNVTVYTREMSGPQFGDLKGLVGRLDDLRGLLLNESYSKLGEIWNTVPTGDSTEEQARDYHDDLTKTIVNNPGASQKVLNELDKTQKELQDSNKSISEIRKEISTIQEEIKSSDSISVGDSTTEITTETVDGVEQAFASTRIPVSTEFGDSLSSDSVTVMATYGNGTQVVVPDKYVSVESSLSSTDTSVVVDDYPLPSGVNTVQFGTTIATSSGVAQTTTTPGDNPLVSGEAPEIESIDASTLRPSAGETVTVDVTSNDADYGGVQSATVYDSSGSVVSSSVDSDGTVSFTPDSTGRHAIRLTIKDTSGNTYTETIQLSSHSSNKPMAPGVRLASGVTGQYLVTGDGVETASISRGENGGVTMGIRVAEGTTRPVHVYSTSSDASSYSVQLLDQSGNTINQHRTVVLHVDKTNKDSIIRRNGEPLIGDAGKITTNNQSTATVIETYTDETGAVSVKINENPSFSERWEYRVDKIISKYAPDTGGVSLVLSFDGVLTGLTTITN